MAGFYASFRPCQFSPPFPVSKHEDGHDMAKKRATTMAAVAALAMVVLAPAEVAAQPAPAATVVFHVTDHEKLPARELADAQQHVSHTFANIGIHVVWTGGCAKLAPADGALHLDILILTSDMVARKNPREHELGEANHASGRVYIYYSRILQHAIQKRGDPAWALGLALAHEVGHMLLPNRRHTAFGLMAPISAGRIVTIPDFNAVQAAAIRAMLTAAAK